jgi:Fumarylacetoacetate (FAA) hydrolase family
VLGAGQSVDRDGVACVPSNEVHDVVEFFHRRSVKAGRVDDVGAIFACEPAGLNPRVGNGVIAFAAANEADVAAAIAGFTIANDLTCRDWQTRTTEWLQGKCWDSSTPDAYHLPVGRPVTHTVYRDAVHQSRLLLPFAIT